MSVSNFPPCVIQLSCFFSYIFHDRLVSLYQISLHRNFIKGFRKKRVFSTLCSFLDKKAPKWLPTYSAWTSSLAAHLLIWVRYPSEGWLLWHFNFWDLHLFGWLSTSPWAHGGLKRLCLSSHYCPRPAVGECSYSDTSLCGCLKMCTENRGK